MDFISLRVILIIAAGPASGKHIQVLPGQKIRVGRRSPSEYTIEADDYLSGVHFAVSNLKDRCLIEDLKSHNGLFVNDQRVERAELRPHDTVGAGASKFVVDFQPEATSADRVTGPGMSSAALTLAFDSPTKETLHGMVAAALSREPGNLFCVLDPAQDDAVLEIVRESSARHEILYEGQRAEDFANYGPYLVELSPPNTLLQKLLENGWGRNWGIFIKTGQQFPELLQHLRRLILVELASGKKVLFRFYDPRVMRRVVTGFTFAEAQQFFGPIASFLCESAKLAEMLKLEVGVVGVETSVIPIKSKIPLASPARAR